MYLGKRVGVTRWIPFLMFCWGIFTIAHGFCKSQVQLVVFRLMIGVFEAGYYPSCAFFFASSYCRFDLAFRLGIFYVNIVRSEADE
jgi:MFS family permease